MQPVQLAGQDVGEHGLVHERVAEAVGRPLLVGEEEPGLDARAQVPVERARIAARAAGDAAGGARDHDVGEQVVLDLAPAHGARPQHGGRTGRHALDPAHDGVVEVRRHRRAGVGREPGRQLLDEQRVAVGPLHHARRHLGRRRLAEQGPEQLGDLARAQAGQLEALGAAAGQLGRELAQRVTRRHVLDPVGADRAHRQGPGGAGEDGDEVEGRPVGPVEVLEHEHHGPGRRRAAR